MALMPLDPLELLLLLLLLLPHMSGASPLHRLPPWLQRACLRLQGGGRYLISSAGPPCRVSGSCSLLWWGGSFCALAPWAGSKLPLCRRLLLRLTLRLDPGACMQGTAFLARKCISGTAPPPTHTLHLALPLSFL